MTLKIKSLPIFNAVDGSVSAGTASWQGIANSAAAASPYLAKLLEAWPDVVTQLSTTSPENMFTQICNPLSTATDVRKAARIGKQKVHLLTALCDLAGVWDWERVTEALSKFADIIMAMLIKDIASDMGFVATDRGPISGLFVMALGKYGGRELNYSSDIDLIVFYDSEALSLPPKLVARPEKTLVRFVRRLMRGFDDVTEHGYVFRTDLRLRPDPRANTVAVSTLTAERYYETLGQNWERAAMIKARYCGGDKQAADEFTAHVITPFIWRRSLDYAAISDIHSIKRQIQEGFGGDSLVVPGHDIKLGIGGIREIEFFASIQQLIIGGRQKKLRPPRTVDALKALADGGYTDQVVSADLIQNYAVLRGLEHRVQMHMDEQTHNWPMIEKHRTQLACLCGSDDYLAYEGQISKVFERVHDTYDQLFAREESLSSQMGSLVFTGVGPEPETLKTLVKYDFRRGSEIWKHMADWLGGRIRATRTPRARELLTRLAPRIIDVCSKSGAPDLAFFNFSEFVENLNAGVTIFSLLVEKPEALEELINLLALAPPLAQTLSTQPALLDVMIEPHFVLHEAEFNTPNFMESLPTDFEVAMNSVRRQVHEQQLTLIAHILKRKTVVGADAAFSSMAEAAVASMLTCAHIETERRYGSLNGDYAIVCLGKFGGQEMNFTSDVDIMLVYDDAGVGALPMYNKLTRRLISALSSSTEEGRLYEVDMALRPSGRSGPLAVSLSAFDSYYRDQAWTWEYMALCRARVIGASCDKFGSYLQGQTSSHLNGKIYNGKLRSDVLDMYERLMQEKPGEGDWDIKKTSGGLRDVEFVAQYLMLKNKPAIVPNSTLGMLTLARSKNWLTVEEANKLLNATSLYQAILQVLSISVGKQFDTDDAPPHLKKLLGQASGFSTFEELEEKYFKCNKTVSVCFNRVFSN